MPSKEQSICEGIQWVDVSNPTPGDMQELSQRFGLNELLLRDCLQPEHLPKYEYVDEVHFLILRYYSKEADKKVSTIQELTNKIALFYTGRFLITIHISHPLFLETIRVKFVHAGRCTSVTDVLSRIVWNALETFDDPGNRLSEQVDAFESQVLLNKTGGDYMEALYYIKREASLAHKVLMMMLEPINHMRAQAGQESLLQDVRDQHLKIQTMYEQVLEDVNNLMSLFFSFSAQRTNDVMKTLTVFSVFFLPLTFIAGIYGMNFAYMPELTKKWGYPGVLILMVVVTIGIYLWIKRKKWL